MKEKAPERLFRDEGGAAIERAARLEDENRQLRAEIDRLKRRARDGETVRTRAVRPGYAALRAVVLGVGMMMGLTLMMTARARRPAPYASPPRPQMPSLQPMPLRAPPVMQQDDGYPIRGRVIDTSPRRAQDDCSPAFWRDARGQLHWKLHCSAE